MKGWRNAFAALLTAAALLRPLPALAVGGLPENPGAAPATPTSMDLGVATPSGFTLTATEADIVSTEGELVEWLDAHSGLGGGGTVVLEKSVEVTSTYYLYGDPIVIDTGENSLIFNGGMIFSNIPGVLRITGEGVGVPVVDVLDMDSFDYFGYNELQSYFISAAGRGGAGGTALRVSDRDDGGRYLTDFVAEGSITATGTGAVGIEFTVPVNAYCFNVSVGGEGSVAVKAPSGSTMWFCKLASSGGSVASNGVLLDTCGLSPAQPGAVRRKITDIASRQRFYVPVKQGRAFDILDINTSYVFVLEAEGAQPIQAKLAVIWDDEGLNALNVNAPGRIEVMGELALPFQGLGLESGFALKLVLDVLPADTPRIHSVTFFGSQEDGDASALLSFWQEYGIGHPGVTLWRSDDKGQTWNDFTSSERLVWYDAYGEVEFYYGELAHPILFKISVEGRGESNVMSIYSNNGILLSDPEGFTGDRTGTDLGGDPGQPEGDGNTNNGDTPGGNSGGTPPGWDSGGTPSGGNGEDTSPSGNGGGSVPQLYQPGAGNPRGIPAALTNAILPAQVVSASDSKSRGEPDENAGIKSRNADRSGTAGNADMADTAVPKRIASAPSAPGSQPGSPGLPGEPVPYGSVRPALSKSTNRNAVIPSTISKPANAVSAEIPVACIALLSAGAFALVKFRLRAGKRA